MELFVLRHAEFNALYNCSGFNSSHIQLLLENGGGGSKFVPEAVSTILLCAVYYVLYVPCMFSIWRHMRDERGVPNACYRLLFYIGCMDLAILWIIGFLHGWLSLQGAVFCTHPTLIYLIGVVATSIWAAESSADLVLAINRCVDVLSPRLGDKLFGSHRIFGWMCLCSLYALYWLLFEKPVLFNGLYFAWFFNPFEGYRDTDEGMFVNRLEAFHDTMIALSSPIIYLLFLIVFSLKTQALKRLMSVHPPGTEQRICLSRAQKMTFLQVFIISLINTLTGSIYVIMQRTQTTQWLITLGQFAWLHIHGIPPVVYLTLNNTIRNDFRLMLVKLFRRKRNFHAHRVGVIATTKGQQQKGKGGPQWTTSQQQNQQEPIFATTSIRGVFK